MRLVLASTSPARLALLVAAGVEPEVVPSDVDEPAAVRAEEERLGRPLEAAELVGLLARAKAEAVLPRVAGDALVLGGDSAFAFDGAILGKPHTADVATARWRAQRGGQGVLWSGQHLVRVDDGRASTGTTAVAHAGVRFASDIDDAEIDAYVASGEPLAVAGAFTIDARGGAFIDRIEGDPSTVVGLSLPLLRTMVRDAGVEWTALWR